MAYVFEDGKPAAGAFGAYTFDDEKDDTSLLRRTVADPLISLAKGVIGVPEAAVGVADLVTGGHAGKFAEKAGFRPKDAKAFLDEFLSPAQQEVNRVVTETKGFLPTVGAMVTNPSTIVHTALESLPSMGAGGAVARGGLAVAPTVAPWIAGAAGEGVVSAGSTAEQIRQQTADGLVTPAQAAIAAGSGALTAGLGAASGKLSRSLGLDDIDTILAEGVARQTGKVPGGVVARAIDKAGMPGRIAAGAVSEGVLEELPQSMQEQAAQNLALGKPLGEGVPEAAAAGMLTGNVMGGVAGAMRRRRQEEQPPDPIQAAKAKAKTDPAKAAMDLLKTAVGDVVAGTDNLGVNNDRTRPDTAASEAPTATQEEVIAHAKGRLAALERIAKGTPEQKITGPDGTPLTIPAQQPQFFTPEQKAERDFLATNIDNPEALAKGYGMKVKAPATQKVPGEVGDSGEAQAARRAVISTTFGIPKVGERVILDMEGDKVEGELVEVYGGDKGWGVRVKDDNGQMLEAVEGDATITRAPTVGEGTRKSPVQVNTSADLEQAAGMASTDYSPPQGEANNIQRGHVRWQGLDATIEVPAGGTRKGTNPETGEPWTTTHSTPYGYFKGTKGGDGMHVDAYFGPEIEANHPVYVIDELDNDGHWRQHKTLIGFPSEAAAREAYLGTSTKNPEDIGAIAKLTVEEFKKWLKEGDTTKALKYGGKESVSPVLEVPEAPAAESGSAEPAPQARYQGAYRDGGKFGVSYETVKRSDGTVSLVRVMTDSDGTRTEHMTDEGVWAKGRPASTAVSGIRQIAGPETFATVEDAMNAAADDAASMSVVPVTEPAPPAQTPAAAPEANVYPTKSEAMRAGEADGRNYTVSPVGEADPDKPWRVAFDESKALKPAPAQKKPAAPSKTVMDQIRAAAAATGKKPAAVKAQFLKDKEAHGEEEAIKRLPKPKPAPKLLGKNAKGQSVYEDEQGVRSYADGGVQITETVELIPTREGMKVSRGELKPEFKTTEEIEAEKPKEEPKTLSAEEQAKLDIANAIADLGEILLSKTGGKLNITPEQEQKLLPVMTRLFDAAFRLGHIKFKEAARFVRDQIRKALGTEAADLLTIEHYQGGYISMSGRYRDQGSETAKDVAAVETLDEAPAEEPKREDETIEFTVQPLTPGAKAETMSVPKDLPPEKPTQDAKPAGPAMTLVPGKHTKTGEAIFTVKLGDRLERDAYTALAAKAKRLGGAWSKFTKGFLFKDEAKAKEFMGEKAAEPETPRKGGVADGDLIGVSIFGGKIEPAKVEEAQWKNAMPGMMLVRIYRDGKFGEPVSRSISNVHPWPRNVEKPAAPADDTPIPADELGGFKEGDDVMLDGKPAIIADLYTRKGLEFANLSNGQEGVPLWRLKKESDTGAVTSTEVYQGGSGPRVIVNTVSTKQPEPQIVARYPGENGTEVTIAKNNKGYAVGMRDTDADIMLPTLRLFTGDDALDKATEYAESVVAAPGTTAPQQPEPETAPIIETEANDERTDLPSESPEALGTVAPEENRPDEDGGDVRGSDARGSGGRAEGSGESDVAGLPDARSGGSGAQAARPAGSGARRRPGAVGARRTRRQGSGVSEESASLIPAAPNIPGANFRITDEVRLGQGGEVEKFRDNLAAIRTLKAIESEQRRATPEEQRTLARYVGWGGLANAFADDQGAFKNGWEDRGKELADLLSSAELKAARRSTRNAHYTSETVVNGLWDAVLRLGYKGGMVLESSMGTGNFIGLMPEEVTGQSKVVGVEYDSLTARIAQALYPQATVLHSGFQKVPLPDGEFDLNIGNPPFGSESLRFQFKPELRGASIHNQFFRAGMDALRPGGIQAMVVSRYLMDAKDSSNRAAMARKAKLLGAIRLPDTAFRENARTDVVTDILFFQRLTTSEELAMEEAFEAQHSKPKRGEEAEHRAAAARLPAWIKTTEVADPLGGERMTVNQYFADNPDMIVGRLERSGKMQFETDENGNKVGGVNVKLQPGEDMEDLLQAAIERLPENVANQGEDAIQRSIERFQSMSDALRIAISGQEAGSMQMEDGKLSQVVERETPNGDFELSKRQITAESPWSPQLLMDRDGKWYRLEVATDAEGKPVKVMKDGKATKRNAYVRTTYESEADIPASLRLGEARYARLLEMVRLRDLLKQQLVLESTDAKTAEMEGNRKDLAKAYADFTKAHGFINNPANAALLAEMPDGALVLALETAYRPELTEARAKKSGDKPHPAQADPAPILKERVLVPYAPPGKADNPTDALAITLAESGRVDMARIASLLGLTEEEAVAKMAEPAEPLIFRDPETETWETRDAYLSGPVKRKLNAARAAGMQKNAEALEKVQPEPWGADKVTAMLGSSWIPEQVYADFAAHLTGGQAKVRFSRATNSFAVTGSMNTTKAKEWGVSTDRASVPFDWIYSHILNSMAIRVTETDSDGKTHLLADETALAQLKAKQIEAEFSDWVFQDGDRRKQLVDLFNEKFNTRVNRQHNGQHLKLPGKVPDAIIAMRRHQMNAIWRGITERFMLLDHVVGAGKTFTAIARAMERRRMGLSKKPMIVVPNHMVEQFTADTYRLYPGAKVLAAGKKDFEKKRRRKLFAKIATGDWDIVIVPHSSFGFIDIAPETEERFLEEELRLAHAAIKEAEEQAEEDGLANGRRKPFNVKEAERLAEKIEGRLDALKSKGKDRLLTFEQMGVDDLTVDEAHEFKNLFYSSRLTNARGMNDKTGSQKSFDLYNKIQVLRESPTGTVTFMTGTPISNSAVEMYQMMRYLAAKELKELGLEHFDAWRAQFVDVSTKWEPTESGRLKEVNRLGRTWSNMRSLMDLYYSFTDAVSIEDIKKWYAEDNKGAQFPVPKVKGGERKSIVVKPTPAQVAKLEEVLAGFDSLPDISDPYERNAERLRLMDRARKVSLDIRAVDRASTSTEKNGKLEQAAREIARIYKAWTKDKGTQLVFLDRSVPKAKGDDKIIKEYDALVAVRDKALSDGDEEAYRQANDSLEKYDPDEIAELRGAQNGGWNAYDQIKKNLVALGVPASQVRFIQEANNDQQKQALFDAVNDGEVRVLLGSTQRMGAGTNVQKRLVALHHVDINWKPSDIEQREGRIIRQGNSLLEKHGDSFEVEILAYATERTMDAKMWDLNSTKLKTINGIRKYQGEFSMDFADDDAIGMAEIAALASGDPLLLERVKLMAEIDHLQLLQRAHRRKMFGIKDQIESYRRALKDNPKAIADVKARAAVIDNALTEVETESAKRKVTVEGKAYTTLFDAMKAATDAVKAIQGDNDKAKYAITIDGKRITNKTDMEEAIEDALGDQDAFEANINGKQTGRRRVAAREIAAMANGMLSELKPQEKTSGEAGEIDGFKVKLYVEKEMPWGGTNLSMTLEDESGKTITDADGGAVEGGRFTTAYVRGRIDVLTQALASKRKPYTDWLENQMKQAEAELPKLEGKDNEPFPKADELAEKNARLEALINELAGKEKAKAAETEVEPSEGDDTPTFSRSPNKRNSGISLDDAKAHWDNLTAGFKNLPRVNFFDRANQAPERLRSAMRRAKAENSVMGAYHNGEIYVFAENIPDLEAMERFVVQHELRHYGMEGKYGNQLRAALLNLRDLNPELRAEADALKAKYKDLDDSAAVNEALADKPLDYAKKLSGWKRFKANLRAWLVAHGYKRLARLFDGPTADEITRDFLYQAEAFYKGKARSETTHLYETNFGRGDAPPVSDSSADQTSTPAFRKWFGNSKVMGADGKPLVVYHGTRRDFSAFDASADEANPYLWDDNKLGFFFTADTGDRSDSGLWSGAAGFSRTVQRDGETKAADGANIMPVYLSLQNPARLADTRIEGDPKALRERLEGEGRDGIITDNGLYIAFRPEQIKSAIGNDGTFDPENPDIRFSRPDLNAIAASARERVGDLLTSQRTFNRWWHTTIGTQFHKAQQDRDFKKVFDLGQEYLTDTTRYAMIPEMEAPDLLLRLEKVKDALPAFLGGRKVLSKADSEAIAAPIFRGTLEDEKVYSDEELKDDFGLTEKQIDYYRQFRAAVDKSLDEMTKSVLAKMARAVGVGEDLVRRLRVSDIGLDAFYKPLVREMRARVRELQERADETTGPDKNLRLNEAAVARKQVRAVVTAYNRVRRLKADGYAPLMRFGKNTVHVQSDDGETLYFGLYESQREANAAARALEQEYPDATVGKGILSEESYKLFNGLSPETVELFADIAGMGKEPAFQEYLRLAVNNRSALKRLMKREGTPGFSQDVPRVLAQFIVSNARTTAGNYHMGDLQKAVEDVPRRKGDVKDEAVKLWKYLTDPQEEVSWLRGYLFFNFLGGSIASALVNATQPVMMTAPYLSQFVDAGKLGKIMAQASMEAAKDAPGADVRQAYDRAMKEGIVAPHEIYQLMAQAQDQIGSGHLHRLMKGWGSFFSLAEAFNRRISFIAAYRVAVEADMANPYQFAKNAVAETQGLYNKGNRPNWARGAVGSTIFTFKQFSISYMEFIKRLPNKQRAMALALLFLGAGAEGEPFAEDIMDAVDTIGQWMGYATNSKRWLRRKAAETLGDTAGQFVLHGVSAFLPLDVSARMGLGNLIPGTGALKTSQIEKSRDATEFLGPIGGVARSAGQAATHIGTGEYGAAVKDMMPVAVQNALKGMDMWQKGEYRDTRGRKVIETTPGEAALKAVGFQPASVAKQQDKVGDNLQDVNLAKATESGIADKWAHGLADQDSDKIAEARRELIRWNANNPELRIVITSQQLKSRVQAIKSTRADRTLKTTPKELRGRVAEDLR